MNVINILYVIRFQKFEFLNLIFKILDEFNIEMQQSNSDNNNFVSKMSPENKIYFTNKVKAFTSTPNTILAIILLVFGISVVIMMFVYLIMSTNYVNKKLEKLKNRNKNKNIDVDADYLINGMYL